MSHSNSQNAETRAPKSNNSAQNFATEESICSESIVDSSSLFQSVVTFDCRNQVETISLFDQEFRIDDETRLERQKPHFDSSKLTFHQKIAVVPASICASVKSELNLDELDVNKLVQSVSEESNREAVSDDSQPVETEPASHIDSLTGWLRKQKNSVEQPTAEQVEFSNGLYTSEDDLNPENSTPNADSSSHQEEVPFDEEEEITTNDNDCSSVSDQSEAQDVLPLVGQDDVSPISLQQDKESDLSPKTTFEPIRPAWEVKSFNWSTVTKQLCGDHRHAFVQLIDSLNLNNRDSARIGVFNTKDEQGSTTLAACMATILSETNARTLMIEMDSQKPDLEKAANLQLQGGWQELIDGDDPLSEFLITATTSKLTLMPLQKEIGLTEKQDDLLTKYRQISKNLDLYFEFSVLDFGSYQNVLTEKNSNVEFLNAAVIVSDTPVSDTDSETVRVFEKLIAAGVPNVVIAENFRGQQKAAA